MYKIAVFLLIFSVFFIACSGNQGLDPSTEDAVLEIYLAMEVYGGKKAQNVVKKYGLDSREKLAKYEAALRNLSTNEYKWKEFLKLVEKAREQHAPNRINRRN